MDLSREELERYGRHLILRQIGKAGQLKLKNARVLLVGAGGLGSPLGLYLPAAGVGTLGLVDFDRVSFSNLHRQVLHSTEDVGKLKVESAREKIKRLNPEVHVVTHETALKAENAFSIIKDYDLVVDGTDNFPVRYLINDACFFLRKPNVYGAIFQFEGQCTVFGLEDGPCYRCLFPEPPPAGEVPSCAEAGVVGVLPGIIGLLQANEVVKLICGIGDSLKGRLLMFDALQARFRELAVQKDPHCPLCGENPTITELIEYQNVCATANAPGMATISAPELRKLMQQQKTPDVVVVDVRETAEWEISRIDGAISKPLSSLEQTYQDIPKDKTVYVHCKMGGRSLKAIEFLKSKGYTNCVQLEGGLDAWESQ